MRWGVLSSSAHYVTPVHAHAGCMLKGDIRANGEKRKEEEEEEEKRKEEEEKERRRGDGGWASWVGRCINATEQEERVPPLLHLPYTTQCAGGVVGIQYEFVNAPSVL